VGEKRVKLSGGQRQRLSIAITILRNPDLLILDEATSHLDSETKKAIQKSLNEITEDRTTLIIAHRLSTITRCDNIVVLKNGEIIAQGNHSSLLEFCSEYKNQWELQIRLAYSRWNY
jgi:ATP-binding cassette subfamily B protein